MYKNVLQTIEGIGIFPIISMLIFLAVFLAAIIWFFKADKEHLQHMAELPLESNNKGKERNHG
ncbi:MAG TPA: CcoQ/FixQ family Cbb3-type cytochrome c oxidase assembly chaperone [Blastocatellia bacterium]|nr:CcoQ/FixQ family Cbb3-type cytochrome c oxidase assembly chaperone [Blastocatellia bacterium]